MEILKYFYNIPLNNKQKNNLAMFHTGRCGSTVIASMLKQNKYIYWDEEVYEKIRKKKTIEQIFLKNQIKILNLRKLYCGKNYGFETKLVSNKNGKYAMINMELNAYINKLKNMNFNKYIILKRKNYLRQVVSGAIGYQTKKWQIKTEVMPKLNKIELNVGNIPYGYAKRSLIAWFEEFETTYQSIEKNLTNVKVLKLYYERDIKNNPFDAYKKICRFIGIKPQNVSIKLRRVNPYPLSQMINNYEEIVNHLKSTPYNWMTEE